LPAQQKARQRWSPAGFWYLPISLAVTSGHGSPPAWMSHDDDGDRDGGGSASDSNVKGKHRAVSNASFASAQKEAENDAMNRRRPGTAYAAAVLCACLAGLAQNQDRDSSGTSKTAASAPAPEQRVDINHASLDELLKVPGLNRGWAVRILRFRPYRTKLDLFEKGVLSSEVYDRIKDFVIAHHDKQ
jgi:DNA uptake protein ComE-like DNA-binding protein